MQQRIMADCLRLGLVLCAVDKDQTASSPAALQHIVCYLGFTVDTARGGRMVPEDTAPAHRHCAGGRAPLRPQGRAAARCSCASWPRPRAACRR